jgi:hypothetical protein
MIASGPARRRGAGRRLRSRLDGENRDPTRLRIADRERKVLRLRSETMELIVGARHAIVQSRLLIAEADTLIPRSKPLCGALPRSAKAQCETLSGDRIQRIPRRGLLCRKGLESIHLFARLNHSVAK